VWGGEGEVGGRGEERWGLEERRGKEVGVEMVGL